jgi:hypothetical protein
MSWPLVALPFSIKGTVKMPSKENLGYICVKSGGPGIWITLERFAQGVHGLELYRNEANLSIVAFTKKLVNCR